METKNKFIFLFTALIILPIITVLGIYIGESYIDRLSGVDGKGIIAVSTSLETVVGVIIYFVIWIIIIYTATSKSISKLKVVKEELSISEERYRIIMSQTDDIIFQWNILKDTVFYTDNWWIKFKYNPITEFIEKNIRNTNKVYSQDKEIFIGLIDGILDGDIYREAEVRLQRDDMNYIWCRIRITGISDEKGKVVKAIGSIIDIDNEKKELEKLLFKAQRDGMTRLYNKETAEKLIRLEIQNNNLEKQALFIIDVDDFKNINDTFGHLNGDKALEYAAKNLRDTFGEEAIIGRAGGDEFIVFLKESYNGSEIIERAQILNKKFNEVCFGEENQYKMSCSIGIATNTQDSFEELFSKADKALYKAKEKGKNTYYIY